MKWTEIFTQLQNYEKEERHNWYSQAFSNRMVTIAQKSVQNIQYTLTEYNFGYPATTCMKEELCERSDERGVYYWHLVNNRFPLSDLPDADDYYVADPVFYPYIAMVNIKSIDNDDGENKKQKALLRIKDLIIKEENASRAYTQQPGNTIFKDCSFCGIGYMSRDAACFLCEHIQFDVMTKGAVSRANRHKRHFGEQEWLFPFISNGFDEDDVLYVRTSSLDMFKGKSLAERKKKTEEILRKILKHAGILEYDIIEIRKPYKGMWNPNYTK